MSVCFSFTIITSVATRLIGGHHHQDQQDEEHHRLGELDGAEEDGVIARPVADVVAIAIEVDGRATPRTSRGAAKRIVERQPQAGDAVAQAVELRGVAHVHEREAAVVFVHARLEDAASP